jgi:CBS domain-containing protein
MTPPEEISPALDGYAVVPPFERARVYDAMRRGLMSCAPDLPLRAVAATMAEHRIHCVVITVGDRKGEGGAQRGWGVVSDADIVGASASDLDRQSAADAAATELLTVSPDESLERATQLMREHQVTHLIVVDPNTDRPIGVLSALDVAGVIAHGGRQATS